MTEMKEIPVGTRVRDNDGLHKRRGIWYYKLKVNGRWRELSTGTRNYHEARKIRQRMVKAHEEGRLSIDRAKWTFEKAAQEWQEIRQGERLAENTRRIERERLKPLLAAFRGKRLGEFTLEDIEAYRRERLAKVGPRTINLEIKVLRMVLQRAKCWGRLADEYKPLKENSRGPGVALTSEEEQRLFAAAARNPLWEAAYLAALVAVNTTMRSVEIRNLRLNDVDLLNRTVTVRREGTKTDAGSRVIPLNETAYWAFSRLLERARLLGATDEEHYLFPSFRFRCTTGDRSTEDTGYDPTRPVKTWRTAWRSLKRAAGLPTLRFHDLRHTSITKLAEAGVPDHVLMAIAGHISPNMVRHYSHVRDQAKRKAVEAMDTYHPAETQPPKSTITH